MSLPVILKQCLWILASFILIGIPTWAFYCSIPLNNLATRSKIEDLLNGKCLSGCSEDLTLIQYIKDIFVQPSGLKPILRKENSNQYKGQHNQVDLILKHYNYKRNGFFIEAGAWDGEAFTNTLHLETEYNWTGLLVEPNEGAFAEIVAKKRNAFIVNSCLSTTSNAEKVIFDMADVFGAIDDKTDPENEKTKKMKIRFKDIGWFNRPEIPHQNKEVQCIPLYSLLLALDNPRVDFFSLDIEGSEMKVLRTIPWEKVNIEVILIEVDKSNITEMVHYMNVQGYKAIPVPPLDYLFVKE